jgi:hypothetical protein
MRMGAMKKLVVAAVAVLVLSDATDAGLVEDAVEALHAAECSDCEKPASLTRPWHPLTLCPFSVSLCV